MQHIHSDITYIYIHIYSTKQAGFHMNADGSKYIYTRACKTYISIISMHIYIYSTKQAEVHVNGGGGKYIHTRHVRYTFI